LCRASRPLALPPPYIATFPAPAAPDAGVSVSCHPAPFEDPRSGPAVAAGLVEELAPTMPEPEPGSANSAVGNKKAEECSSAAPPACRGSACVCHDCQDNPHDTGPTVMPEGCATTTKRVGAWMPGCHVTDCCVCSWQSEYRVRARGCQGQPYRPRLCRSPPRIGGVRDVEASAGPPEGWPPISSGKILTGWRWGGCVK
jgi:hypothetical protein